jgi:hypothetical protein
MGEKKVFHLTDGRKFMHHLDIHLKERRIRMQLLAAYGIC